MLTIVQRGGATREKPPEVVRGQAARLPWVWEGLCFGVPFNDATRDAARDLVSNAAPSGSSGLAWERDNRGSVAAYLSDVSYLEYPHNPLHSKPSTAVTLYARVRRAGSSSDPGAGVIAKVISTSTPYDSYIIQQNDTTPGAMAGYISVDNSNHIYFPSTYVLSTSVWHTAILRWATGLDPRLDVYDERGQVVASTSWGAGISGSISYGTNQPIRVNAGEDVTANFHGAYSQTMVWSRRLSDTEVQALVADPYGWYSPRRETIGLSSPYPLVAGAGEMKFGTGSGGLR